MALVNNDQIKSSELLNSLPTFRHLYIWPFAIVWPIFARYYLDSDLYEKHIGAPEWTFVWCGSIITAQSLVWLSTHWSVNLRATFTASKAKAIEDAELIKVIPIANAGTPEICKIERENVVGKVNTSFLFQKRRFLYDPETKTFSPLAYAIDAEPKPKLDEFQKSKGITSQAEVTRIEQYYGTNTFDIPVPTFTELFKEHAVAPFFVFQIFCVGLWMLDEYWYYSLFTLFMLVAFESTVVWQRQRTLNEFRGMSIKPYNMWVYRLGQWTEVQSDKLLPGDLASVSRTKEDSGVACDMLLVEGAAIVNEAMLSGESTPLLKDSIQLRPGDASLDPEGLDKNAFLWGGTKVLQVTHGNPDEERPKLASGVPLPPDNGAMAIVIKTGFETSQGSLVRTMIYSTERVSANNAEALFFILFLLIFAIAASWYVWDEGVKKDRKRSKLLLDCVLIVTSVVPPELPMELSLAVNTSLAALAKLAIFCTEPFRIPFAGRVDIACFDKTGTLTGEDLVVDGIAGLGLGHSGTDTPVESDGAHSHVTPVKDAGMETTLVLATAHALVKLDEGDIVGDPMEKATLTSLGWVLGKNDILSAKPAVVAAGGIAGSVQVKRRFQFSSALKRQSSVATVNAMDSKTGNKMKGTFVGVKGAPETIMKMLASVPKDYEETFKYFTRRGSRVLALAYKQLTTDNELGSGKINDLKREKVEADLTFAGFLVLQCPLKEDAKQAVQMLNESSHRVVMITGDNPLTAVHVAREVEIVDREVLILDAPEHNEGGEKLVWKSVDDKVSIDVDPAAPIDTQILKTKDICVTGYALTKLKDKDNQAAFRSLLRYTWVYARVSPKQKEDILIGMRDLGYYTLMAGDGTNDVGALKQAHIGIALLNGTQEDLTRIAEHSRNTKMKEMYQKQVDLMKRFNQPAPPVPVIIAHLYPPGPSNPHLQKAIEREAQRKNITPQEYAKMHGIEATETITSPAAQQLINADPRQAKQQAAAQKAAGFADKLTSGMMDMEMDDEPPTLKLGDASVAAPFTSKLRNVIAVPNIIRQGRCTLVATIQMYKILALNCLISAYSLSVLYLEGIKFGDGQYTISGMLMSVCFLSISRARTVEGLSKERPQPNIFNFYIIGSILGQFAIHISTLVYIARYCEQLDPRGDGSVDLEAEFSPSLLNTAVYLLQLIQQISTFAVNYQGRPFRESISENKGMFWGIIGVTAIAFSCSTKFIPELNEKMMLVDFSNEFSTTLTTVMILDYVGCYTIEVLLKRLFSDFQPRDIAIRRKDQDAREKERKSIEQAEKAVKEEKARLAKVEEYEKRIEERRRKIQEWSQGRQQPAAAAR
ncbi:putative Manganese-transporting ATPase 1 [Seiridium cardinale]